MADISIKTLTVLKYLWEYSDDNHTVSTYDIIEYADNEGVSIDRHTIKPIIAQLLKLGFDVIEIKGSPNRYFIGSRLFELAELKLLVDAVESSKFITEEKSKDLVLKILSLTSKPEAKELNRHLYVDGRVKSESKTLLYTVDALNTSINEGKQVEFKYFDYTVKKERIHKHDGYIYKFSPYALVWHNDFYYVIGFSEKHGEIGQFRVDRIDNIKLTDNSIRKKPDKFNPVDYLKKVFSMYDGPTRQIRLKCSPDMMKVMIDTFGKDLSTTIAIDGGFFADVEVSISQTFFGWVFSMNGAVSIVSPEDVKQRYLDMASKVISTY